MGTRGEGGEQLIAEELDNIFYGNVESENVIKNLQSHAEEQNKEDVMYQGQKEKFITYFILDEDQHNMICVSSKSISSVAECIDLTPIDLRNRVFKTR